MSTRGSRFLTAPIASAPTKQPVVIGVYGVSGCGKSYLLQELKTKLGEEQFSFIEGSEVISELVPGGLAEFQDLTEEEKRIYRAVAIDHVGKEGKLNGKATVVAGHYMFWGEGAEERTPVWTLRDQTTFTHIIYLSVPVHLLLARRTDDLERNRSVVSAADLHQWQETEKNDLRRICGQHGILFAVLPSVPDLSERAADLIKNFGQHTEAENMLLAEKRLDTILKSTPSGLEKMLVIDADRTLSATDTGHLFWEHVGGLPCVSTLKTVLKTIFNTYGYSHTAFRQATLLYQEISASPDFDAICDAVAEATSLYSGMISLLRAVTNTTHVGVIIVTCGLSQVWEQVLAREGFAGQVRVIGNGLIMDDLIVTPVVKKAVVSRLQKLHQLEVWAFGDSVLDIGMMIEADHAIVVVGDDESRSQSMDGPLAFAIDSSIFQARQAIMVPKATPRLDMDRLPLVEMEAPSFLEEILSRRFGIRMMHATDQKATMLLMTLMRDARMCGPALRTAHHEAGSYLARVFVVEVIGVEPYPIPHVQGNDTQGFRLLDEARTLIVALMRGGEPMALGVNAVFPLASFLHAKQPQDMTEEHLCGMKTIILVDSVINTGDSMMEFIQAVRAVDNSVRIVVVAGVVQADSISRLKSEVRDDLESLSLVALRISQNKFKGQGRTDTGNRLFNTTYMD